MIMNPEDTGKLPDAITEGGYYGMQTFDQALLEHVQAGIVSMDEAMRAATHPHDFKLLVAAVGRRATSMSDLEDARRSEVPPPAPVAGPSAGSSLSG